MTGSVTRLPSFRSVLHINVIGLLVVTLIAIILLPLLPFLLVVWFLGKQRNPRPSE